MRNKNVIPDRIPVSSPDLVGYTSRKLNAGRMPDGQVRIIIRFDGMLDEARIAKAVRLSFDAEPVTGCRLVERPVRLYWQRCQGLDSVFEFHEADDHKRGIEEFFLAPFDLFNEPQVKVALYRSGYDTLYVKMSHILADGGASMEYLELLSGIYRRLEDEPDYRPDINLKGSRSGLQVLRHIKLRKMLSASTKISASKSSWSFPEEKDGTVSSRLFIKRIMPERLAAMKAYAKDRGATVGDLVLTAYYRALFEAIDPPEGVPLTVSVPVNLRKYIPGGKSEGLCSLAAAYFPKIPRNKGEPFEDTLTRVHAAMEDLKLKQDEVGQLFIMEALLAPGYIAPRILNPFLSSMAVMPCYSNIGVVNPKAADFGDVNVREIIPAGPMSSPPNLTLGSSTYNGEMVLTTSVLGTEAHSDRIEMLLDAMIKEMPGYVANDRITDEAAYVKEPVTH